MLRLTVEELGISKDMAHTIIHDDLGKWKIWSRFVPHKLTDELFRHTVYTNLLPPLNKPGIGPYLQQELSKPQEHNSPSSNPF